MDDLYVFKKQDFINLLDEISENNTKEMLQKTDIEKTQLSEENATSDCISRQAAIDEGSVT